MHTPTSFAFETQNELREGFKYSSSQWDIQMSRIRQLYILENRTAVEIVDILSGAGFHVTERQLKHRIKKWHFNTKNIRESEMLEMARLRLKRRNCNGKQSAFVIKETQKGVEDAKIDRFLKRKNISDHSLLSMASPAGASTPDFSVLTPSASSFKGAEEEPTQAEIQISSTPLYPPRTPSPPPVISHPTCSYLSFLDNPENWKPNPWPELRAASLEPLDLITADWIQGDLSPALDLDVEMFFDLSQYEMDPEETVSIPQISPAPLCLQAEEEKDCKEQHSGVELLYGPDHVETLDSKRSLAFALYKGARYKQAEELLREVVASGQKAFGDNHLAVIESRLHLSIVIQEQGKYSEAEDLQIQLLNALIMSGKEHHKHTLQTKLALAVTLTCQTRFDEAAPIQYEVFKVCQERFGNEDPLMLQAMGDYASSQVKMGVHNQSVNACRIMWNTWKAAKGDSHPQTLAAKLNTAIAMSEDGNYNGSYRLAYEIWCHRELSLGAEHPDTLRVESHLAFCHDQQALHGKEKDREGLHAQAEEIYRRVWTTKKIILGETHPDTLRSLLDIALHLQRRHMHREAEILFKQVLDTRPRVGGDGHLIHALHDLSHVATSKLLQQKHHEAEILYREVLRRCKILKVEVGPHVFTTEKNLAVAIANQGRGDEAVMMLQATLRRCCKALGDQHLTTMDIMSTIAIVLRGQGSYKEAEEMLRNTLTRYRKALGDDHLTTGGVMFAVADLLKSQERFDDAVLVFQELLDIRIRVLGTQHPLTKKSVTDLESCAAMISA